MCGRTSITISASRLRHITGAKTVRNLKGFKPRFNVAPQSCCPIVFQSSSHDSGDVEPAGGGRSLEVCFAKWGLVPSYASAPCTSHFATINARSERLAESPLYGRLVNSRRCVIVLDGFYEWKSSTPKTPYFIRLKNSIKATSFAGVLRAEHSKEEKSSEHVKEEKSAYGKEEKSESFVGLKKRRSNSSDSTSAVKTEPSQKRHCPTETLTTQLSSFHNTPKGSVHVKIEGAADASLLGHKAATGGALAVVPDAGGGYAQHLEFTAELAAAADSTTASIEGADSPALIDNEAPLLVAGLYDVWAPREGESAGVPSLYSFTIVTMPSVNTALAGIHDRMPVCLNQTTTEKWLDVQRVPLSSCLGDALRQSQMLGRSCFDSYEVSRFVSTASHQGRQCIVRAAEAEKKQGGASPHIGHSHGFKATSTITKYFSPKSKSNSMAPVTKQNANEKK
eukprot:GHVT01088495.1.p1 GENE.GHVT01088495.1~~GHVT01088495.1.p1  ORF type:complete len:451 (+),score=58.95 GHVT01088495.1:365-1717(+)